MGLLLVRTEHDLISWLKCVRGWRWLMDSFEVGGNTAALLK